MNNFIINYKNCSTVLLTEFAYLMKLQQTTDKNLKKTFVVCTKLDK